MSSLNAGTRLGPYEVLAKLGEGGMGEVCRARDTRLDRTVALKVLATHLATDPQLYERFEREARAISSLNHPNICVLHDIGHSDGVDFIVMEFLEGRNSRGEARPQADDGGRGSHDRHSDRQRARSRASPGHRPSRPVHAERARSGLGRCGHRRAGFDVGQRNVLINGGTDGRLSSTGHLIYLRDGTLFAVGFDEASLTVNGVAKPVQPGVEMATAGFSGAAQLAISTSGTLAFVSGRVSRDNSLLWIDREGRAERAPVPSRRYQAGTTQMRVSPDGTKVALTILAEAAAGQAGAGQDVWVWDLEKQALSRLSFRGVEGEGAKKLTWPRDCRFFSC